MEWIFDGIGTAIVSLIAGILFGIGGVKLYDKKKNKQSQKAGNGAIQLQTSSPDSPIGDVVGRDKIIIDNKPGEFNSQNLNQYQTSDIEHEISKGNNDTIKEMCFELIFNNKQDVLIMKCINKMDNDAEKYKLIENLTKYDLIDSKYTKILANTITNANYQIRLIKLFISYEKLELIEQIFYLIKNNQYVYDSLIEVHQFDKKLFDKLYNNGDCFRNQRYRIKMKEFLEKNEGHKLEIH